MVLMFSREEKERKKKTIDRQSLVLKPLTLDSNTEKFNLFFLPRRLAGSLQMSYKHVYLMFLLSMFQRNKILLGKELELILLLKPSCSAALSYFCLLSPIILMPWGSTFPE